MSYDRDVQFGALKIYAVVAESDTLTGAARKLGLTQSAVSQAINQLEALTGNELVVRRSRPIKLTIAGQVMKDHADQIIRQTRQMLKDIATVSIGELPRLAIGSVDSFVNAAGQQLIEKLSAIAPQLSLQTGLVMPLSEALLARDLDILISSDPLEGHPELECHPILRDPFVLLVSARHYDSAPPATDVLAREVAFARYTRQSRLGMLTDLVMRRLRLEPLTRYEFDSTQALIRTVQAGHAWAITTSLCLMQHPSLLQDVRLLPLAGGANARYLSLLARKNELGDTPLKIAAMCRDIYTADVLPEALRLMPWLDGRASAVTEAPMIWSA